MDGGAITPLEGECGGGSSEKNAELFDGLQCAGTREVVADGRQPRAWDVMQGGLSD